MSPFHIAVTAVLIGLGASIDNVTTGIAYGMLKLRIPPWVNLVINAIGLVAVITGCLAGDVIARFLPERVATWMAAAFLIGIGLGCWYVELLHHRLRGTPKRPMLRTPGWHEAIVLGVGLSFTNLVSGLGATLSSPIMLWPTIIAVTVAGYLAIWIGNLVARNLLAHLLGEFAPLLGGLLLIGAGVYELFGG